MNTIYEEIRSDHDKHREMLDKLEKTSGDSEERRKLWEDFYYEVKAHAAAEEETFYAKLMERPRGQDDARHSVSEHKELDDILEELNSMGFDNPGWLTRFKTLKHDYEHHIDEEEEEIFAKAREVLPDADSKHFTERFLARKAAERKLVDQKARESLEE
ncbi:hemerythrin domain-containing protein [Oricola cellulosilytica]|uniref:Hemerythrin domain-containing protein n=1 Tax=Oricola cellulosilytica TaxID=1429082 RepID=A0A4R0PAK4_9HYPH|nr:hemerythrin domain-containing protein [Oricola cellulosilytica]TCD14282.1 hemerythrin domain-containing protein [Oricola cellulosilytica]